MLIDSRQKSFSNMNRVIRADREGIQRELVRRGCVLRVIGHENICAWLLKRTLVISIIVACVVPSIAAQDDMSEIQTALSEIKTVSGSTAWDRMRKCGIKIDASTSSIDQHRIDLVVTLPGRQGRKPTPSIALSWLKKVEGWVPNSSWAQTLVDRRGRLDWMSC
jgi:hypothetical protein